MRDSVNKQRCGCTPHPHPRMATHRFGFWHTLTRDGGSCSGRRGSCSLSGPPVENYSLQYAGITSDAATTPTSKATHLTDSDNWTEHLRHQLLQPLLLSLRKHGAPIIVKYGYSHRVPTCSAFGFSSLLTLLSFFLVQVWQVHGYTLPFAPL